MELYEIIENDYSIGSIIEIEKTKHGSGNTYFVETNRKEYIAKINERMDFVHIYDKVQKLLNEMNLLQSCIIKTNCGGVMTSEGVVLYEFIDGDSCTILTKSQSENAIRYIRKYNKALSLIPFKIEELDVKNHWDKARSIDFIINEFSNYLIELEIDTQDKKYIYDAINMLSKNKSRITDKNKQLIHSDLGADNFIFKDDKVISIIDFTPEYNHEVYSLCQFIYWNYLWNTSNINKDDINNYLKIYNFDDDINIEKDAFYLLLLNAALYRIVGPLIDKLNRNNKDYKGLKKRFFILKEVLNLNQ
ncbi:phosphotransferase [Tissierella carlieri]|uniref:Phosphotransferase n=1 Tax=Tissierella carlieri TaxID=689904 RepID=A0ABT1SAR8_9FIRM|nr:phosphotransferase [Tissierella carlieri]MCQ4923575.1 phosphotransferase [Tissierella carlieri]